MCISPDELSSEELERNIEDLQRLIDTGRYQVSIPRWTRRIEQYRRILQERAEGTYDLEGAK